MVTDFFMKQYELLHDAGVDEVGRGCLAGPVTICSLRLRDDSLNHLLRDSKKLSEKKREMLFEKIIEISDYRMISYPIEIIDKINILQATLLGMKETLEDLNPAYAFIDGNMIPNTHIPCEAIIKGDDLVPAISAASIIAKVTRDNYMKSLDNEYPKYGFGIHKGYGTKAHLEAVKKYGVTPFHRKTFAPIRDILIQPTLF